MSNFSALIATIQANIKTNGQEEITGAILQDVLEAMVDALGTEAINNLETALGTETTNRQNADTTLGNSITTIEGKIPSDASSSNKLTDKAYVDGLITTLSGAVGDIEDAIENGYVYAGIATPSGTPTTGRIFYLAITAGTYTNYGGLVVTQGINILKYDGTDWSQEQLIGIDEKPLPESEKLVKSGALSNILANIDIKRTEYYGDHNYWESDGTIGADNRYRATKIDVSLYNTLYVRSRSNVGSSACVLTNASGTVLTYWNFDGSKIETIDLTQYNGAKWFLYSNFAPYLPEDDMLIQAYLNDGISGYITKHDSQLNDVDNTPTQNSKNFVKSGGVKSYVDALREDVCGELGKTIAEAIQMTQGALIYTGGTAVGSVVDLTPHTRVGGEYAIVPCQAGDKFIINGNYYGIARCFAFLDADNKLLQVASTFNCVYRKVEAPTNSAKIVINNDNNSSAVSYKAAYLFGKENETDHNEFRTDISNLKKFHNFGVDIHDFSHFVSAGSSWTITTDNKTATSNGNGYANRLSFDKESFEDASILSAKITPNSNTFNILIGKTYADIDNTSTLLGVLKDGNGTYLTVNTIINSSEVSMKHKFDVSSLHIGNGFTFYLKLEKSTQDTTLFNVSVTDDLGNHYEVEGLGNGETLADDLLSFGNGEIEGSNWGKITVFCESGGAVFSDISFGYPLLMSDLALTIIGHSMVEAGTITPQRNKRFAALLRDSIGADRVCIIGQGGMNTGTEGLTSYIDNILEYVKSSKYILFCLGANDGDSEGTCIRFSRINEKVIAKGIRPIWMTVIPKRDGTTFPITNAYIRENFEYVDIEPAFYTAAGVIDTTKYEDAVHPSVKGYQAMYDIIQNDKSVLWTV